MRTLGLVVAALVLLSGCGGGGASYGSAGDVAKAAGLTGCKATTSTLAADEVDCGSAATEVMWFTSSDAVAAWLKVAKQVSGSTGADAVDLHGSNWIVECQSVAQCQRIQKRIGGTTD